jgi:hypothetical protein
VAETEADFAGSATSARVEPARPAVGRGVTGRRLTGRRVTGLVTGRPLVRLGAVVLALLGVAALVVRPAGRTRAEARVTVRAPFVVGDVVGAVLGRADGAQVAAHSRVVTISFVDAHRDVARARVDALARAGLDAARQQLIASQTRVAGTARSDRAQAAAQIASIASRTGITDPASAYRQRVVAGQNLEAQRAAAATAGQPLTALNGAIAENQQEVFELQLQVTRHAELVAALNAADSRAIRANKAIASAQRDVGSASVVVSDHATGGTTDARVAGGVAALVIAALVLGAGLRRPRPVAAEDAAPAAPAARGARLPWTPDEGIRTEENGTVAAQAEEINAEEINAEEINAEEINAEEISAEKVNVEESEAPALAEAERAALESCGRRESRYLVFYRALEPSSPPTPVVTPEVVDLVEAEARERAAIKPDEPTTASDAAEPTSPAPQVARGE